jgi:CDP-diacylglycerol--serine O-phosphatidyltransferase
VDIKKQLPSIATLSNAGAGFLACAFASVGRPELSALFVLLAVFLDSLDGALARSLDATSELGAELDSLADVISFGVAPAVLVGSLLPAEGRQLGWLMVTAFPMCAAWRLARFNVTARGTEGGHGEFLGLPTTGAGAAAATAVLVHLRAGMPAGDATLAMLPYVMLMLAALMVSSVSYTHVGTILGRLRPSIGALAAAAFALGSILWRYEILFAAAMWAYVVSGPFQLASDKLRALRHA